ncbi:hypothetical protein SDC9_182535 [bioreactor metagenome]|uniref:Uncharacterized protein n=1 Tax=bioreactor metagenome TaxID=1076179 RepID=A0A645H7P3_9ZZZZ
MLAQRVVDLRDSSVDLYRAVFACLFAKPAAQASHVAIFSGDRALVHRHTADPVFCVIRY